ncbi:variant leucine-rich repeat-containing protein [Planktothrix mougeotii]|uniref:Leucine rich repeat variant domain-containing protein n=1 Tax=Planktothrix mougeotii LEGE 06226 TaxID=1828728 RepID=A0ABR9UDZ6_9CYAN|nr:hypothetical protein [Planktothrix mougeotii]MBE9144642.1 hypothetical protein [Planktothrix mougeotii LEGE 06226]
MILPECIILQHEAANPTTSGERLVELAQQNIELARLVANNSNAPPEVLKALGMSVDVATRHLVATNPNTPGETLIELLNEFPKPILSNPQFSILCSTDSPLLHQIPLSTIRLLVQFKTAPDSFFKWAANHPNPNVLAVLKLSSNPH